MGSSFSQAAILDNGLPPSSSILSLDSLTRVADGQTGGGHYFMPSPPRMKGSADMGLKYERNLIEPKLVN